MSPVVNKKMSFWLFMAIIFTVLLMSTEAFAQAPVNVYNPITAATVPELINNIVRTVLGIVGAVSLFMFVYGGFMWLTSAGIQSRIERGRNTLIWATIGLLVVFSSYAILNFIFTALSQ